MNRLEQEGLLLRQVAGLCRRGWPLHRALDQAAQGLEPGALRSQADRALHALEAGEDPPSDAEPLVRLLGSGNTTPDRLEYAAAAREAHLWAQSSASTGRLYLSAAIAGPLVLAAILGWGFAAIPDLYPRLAVLPPPTRWLLELLPGLRIVGVPLAVVAVFLVYRFAGTWTPGYRDHRLAASLLEMAAAGGHSPSLPLPGPCRRFFHRRREEVGAARAGGELAGELSRQASSTLLLFRHGVPVVAAVVAFPVLVAGMGALVLPLFLLSGSVAF